MGIEEQEGKKPAENGIANNRVENDKGYKY